MEPFAASQRLFSSTSVDVAPSQPLVALWAVLLFVGLPAEPLADRRLSSRRVDVTTSALERPNRNLSPRETSPRSFLLLPLLRQTSCASSRSLN